MSNRAKRAFIARETLEIMAVKGYTPPKGQFVSIGKQADAAISNTVLYGPEDFEVLEKKGPFGNVQQRVTIEVNNETTFAAASRLVGGGDDRVVCLNFASAKHPGGGFLSGAQAQEECLARASGLYHCLIGQAEMYAANRKHHSSLYLDYMIYSPDVPVFRDDHDVLLETPYGVSIITAPAVNAGAVRQNELHNVEMIGPTMYSRVEKVLAIAASRGYEILVLGAWGCGVFGNDPAEIAGYFRQHLESPRFRNAFRHVVFAVLDHSSDGRFINPFIREFPNSPTQ